MEVANPKYVFFLKWIDTFSCYKIFWTWFDDLF